VQGNSISVERVINAPAGDIFAMIADAGRHSSFDGSGTVDHSPDTSKPLALGSKFGMSMRGRPETLFLPYRTTNTVIEFEPDRRIAWQTRTGPLGLIGGRIWRYELHPVEGGTLVRETWDVSRDRQRPMLKMGTMPKQAEDGMRATLQRIAAILELPWADLACWRAASRRSRRLVPPVGAACLPPPSRLTCAEPSSDGPL
jgi:uncharacterized protein YndB with AHSA1/START domain